MTRLDQRRRAAARLVVVLFAFTMLAGVVLLIPTTPGNTSHALSPMTTVTSTIKAWKWDPANPTTPGEFYDSPRTVTVDQTEDLVSQVVHVSWANFSASSNTNALGPGSYPVHVYECDRAEPVDPGNCFGDTAFVDEHPGYGLIGNQTNAVQTYTGADGTGSVDFDILTGADNPALNCSPTHQCSLVVVPWAGGKPAVGAKPADCNDHSLDLKFSHGQGFWSLPGGSQLNRGCDWASRLVIPLSFAPTPLNCPARDADVSTEGSPMMRRAIDQWRTKICNGGSGRDPLQVQYTGLSEYQARSDFDRSAIDVGLTSQPATDPTRKFGYAPIGITSIAVAYYVDDPRTGRQITDLKLSPRLIAKILTQSYTDGLGSDCSPSAPGSYACAPEVDGNPPSIFDDPEFQQLNSVCPSGCTYTRFDFPFVTQGNSSPDVVYGLSDNTYQLTKWLASDTAASDFLAGKKDPFGMHVNTAYLPSVTPKYPIEAFNANDPGHIRTVENCGTLEPYGSYSCAVGGLQNNWYPINGLDNVAKTLVSGKNTAKLYLPTCDGDNPPIRGVCSHYTSAPSEPLGTRGLFAIVSGGDAAAFQFPTSQLETHTGSGKFVALTSASVTAALGDMKTNGDGTTKSLDYKTLDDPNAYPLTTISYAMAPTCGLSSSRSAAAAAFLDYAASDDANTSGVQPGELAPGYLPMPADLRAETHDLAGRVATERSCSTGGGTSTSSTPTPTGGSSSRSTSAGGGTNPGSGGGNGGGVGQGAPDGGSSAPSSGAPSPIPSATGSQSPAASTTPAAFRLPQNSTGAPALMLPIILCVGAGLLLAGPAVGFFSRRGGFHLRGRR